MSEDIKPEVIKRTQDTLGKFIKKPQLMEKFLKKPPFRFLHDIVTAVIRETGFLKGLFSPEEMNCENLKDRDSKVAFLQKLIDAVKTITGEALTARPSKIVAGQEPTKTNELLQAIGKALMNKLSSADVVEQMKLGKASKSTPNKSKTTTPGKVASQGQVKERSKTKEPEKSDKKRTLPSKPQGPDSKSNLRKEDKKEVKTTKEKKARSVSVTRTKDVAKKDEQVKIKKPDVEETVEIEKVPAPLVVTGSVSPELHVETQNDNLEGVGSGKEEPSDMSAELVVEPDTKLEQHGVAVEKDLTSGNVVADKPLQEEPTEVVRRPPSALGTRKQSAKAMTAVRGSGDALQKQLQQNAPSEQSDPEAKPQMSDEQRGKKRPVSAARPGSARRSARPASARPAAPRIRDRGEVVVAEDVPAVPGRVKVIPEGDAATEAEEDDTFVVLEAEPMVPAAEEEEVHAGPGAEARERGHLVAQILETQKELEGGSMPGPGAGKAEVEWDAGRIREREAAGKEMERLRASIQTLARAAHPLGKLVDYLQEDVDAMQRELGRWRARRTQLVHELRQEQELTRRSVEPLRLRLQTLQEAVDEQRDLISATRASVLRNDERVSKLLSAPAQSLH